MDYNVVYPSNNNRAMKQKKEWAQELLVLTKALESVVDFICFRTKFYVSAWVFGGGIEPAECQVDWITISAVEIIAIARVAVRDTDEITVLLQPHHWVVRVWTHVLRQHSTHDSSTSIRQFWQLGCISNKAIVDSRLRPRHAARPPTGAAVGRTYPKVTSYDWFCPISPTVWIHDVIHKTGNK